MSLSEWHDLVCSEGTGNMRPLDIKFGQNSISHQFRDGRSIYDLFEAIMNHMLFSYDLPPLEVLETDTGVYCIKGNRRLFVLKKLDQYCMSDHVRVRKYRGPPAKITATDAPIRIRGKPEVEDHMNGWLVDLHRIVFAHIPADDDRFGF